MKLTRRKWFVLLSCIAVSMLWITGASSALIQSGRSLYAKIELFSTIFQTIQDNYVEETDPQALIESAIEGMVSSLDPHTTYFTREKFEEWNQNFEGYSGIGVYFDVIRGKITILSVISGGPSDKVGLLTGDRIIAIDGRSAVGIKRDDVPLRLKGPRGSTVNILIERKGWKNSRNFSIVRDDVHIESVPYAFMVQPHTGYINIARFSMTTGKEFRDALIRLDAQGMEKLVIDLRQNGGGYLESAVEVVDQFLTGGKCIVYTKGRIRDSFREYFSTEQTIERDIPVIVLIDRASASASEIVAGAMQDWDRALIVGENSFGKGLVQGQFPLKDGSALLMTTARYYTPSGRLIQRSYDEKTHEQYFTEIFDDDRREALENDQSRPQKYTLILSRKVLGGGGIEPDIPFTVENDTLSALMRRLVYAPERFFFTYVDQYMKNNLGDRVDFNEFLRSYTPNGSNLQKFLSYIREQGFKISNHEFVENKEDIQFFLKLTMASIIWGEEARYKVQMMRDRQLMEALTHLPASEKLVKNSYSYKGRK
ncbi:S41 family peptidase [bacterium]|nr:S41 family peptidase [bacterium]